MAHFDWAKGVAKGETFTKKHYNYVTEKADLQAEKGFGKCSKKLSKTIDTRLSICDSSGTHGKHKLHYENKTTA